MIRPDPNDLAAAVGFLLVVTGVAFWSIPAAMVVVGLGLLLFGLAGARSRVLSRTAANAGDDDGTPREP